MAETHWSKCERCSTQHGDDPAWSRRGLCGCPCHDKDETTEVDAEPLTPVDVPDVEREKGRKG